MTWNGCAGETNANQQYYVDFPKLPAHSLLAWKSALQGRVQYSVSLLHGGARPLVGRPFARLGHRCLWQYSRRSLVLLESSQLFSLLEVYATRDRLWYLVPLHCYGWDQLVINRPKDCGGREWHWSNKTCVYAFPAAFPLLKTSYLPSCG